MDELACFAPGMLALGASGYGPEKSEQIMNLAKEVNLLFIIEDFKSLLVTLRTNIILRLLIQLPFLTFHSCHSLLGPAIISTNRLPRSWLERTIFSMLDR